MITASISSFIITEREFLFNDKLNSGQRISHCYDTLQKLIYNSQQKKQEKTTDKAKYMQLILFWARIFFPANMEEISVGETDFRMSSL